MIALIFNDGLGLAGSSQSRPAGVCDGGTARVGQGGVGVSVNGSTGNLVVTDQDEILIGRGLTSPSTRT